MPCRCGDRSYHPRQRLRTPAPVADLPLQGPGSPQIVRAGLYIRKDLRHAPHSDPHSANTGMATILSGSIVIRSNGGLRFIRALSCLSSGPMARFESCPKVCTIRDGFPMWLRRFKCCPGWGSTLTPMMPSLFHQGSDLIRRPPVAGAERGAHPEALCAPGSSPRLIDRGTNSGCRTGRVHGPGARHPRVWGGCHRG